MKKYIPLPSSPTSSAPYVDDQGNKFNIATVPVSSEKGFCAPTLEDALAHYGLSVSPKPQRVLLTPKVKVPSEILNWRAKAILELRGLLPQLETALSQMQGEAGIVARAAWNSGASIARNGPTVAQITAALQLSEAEVDQLFIDAASIIV